MFSSVTNWLGVGDKSEENAGETSSENKENASTTKANEAEQQQQQQTPADGSSPVESKDTLADSKQALEDVSAMAINTAKEWGSYLFSVGKMAGQSVADTASKLKHTVEEKTLLGDFSKEQDKFVTEKKEKKKLSEAAVPPWVGYNEEDQMKTQIMALSKDKRNFLRNPPSGVQFNFDFQATFPVAVSTLQEDPNLQKMRFELVPKQINEETFWRNYFYRVSLIKQSTQLTSLAQQTGTTGESRSSGSSRRSSSSDNGNNKGSQPQVEDEGGSDPDESSTPISTPGGGPVRDSDDLPPESPQESEFISDTFADNQLNEEELQKDLEQLGMQEEKRTPEGDDGDVPEWEQELQKELQEYEMVNGGSEDEDLENEILQQLEEEGQKEG